MLDDHRLLPARSKPLQAYEPLLIGGHQTRNRAGETGCVQCRPLVLTGVERDEQVADFDVRAAYSKGVFWAFVPKRFFTNRSCRSSVPYTYFRACRATKSFI